MRTVAMLEIATFAQAEKTNKIDWTTREVGDEGRHTKLNNGSLEVIQKLNCQLQLIHKLRRFLQSAYAMFKSDQGL